MTMMSLRSEIWRVVTTYEQVVLVGSGASVGSLLKLKAAARYVVLSLFAGFRSYRGPGPWVLIGEAVPWRSTSS